MAVCWGFSHTSKLCRVIMYGSHGLSIWLYLISDSLTFSMISFSSAACLISAWFSCLLRRVIIFLHQMSKHLFWFMTSYFSQSCPFLPADYLRLGRWTNSQTVNSCNFFNWTEAEFMNLSLSLGTVTTEIWVTTQLDKTASKLPRMEGTLFLESKKSCDCIFMTDFSGGRTSWN